MTKLARRVLPNMALTLFTEWPASMWRDQSRRCYWEIISSSSAMIWFE
jgi:hypothetical protein